MQRDPDPYGLQPSVAPQRPPEAPSPTPARSPDDHLNAAHKINQAHRERPPDTVLWKYSGPGQHVTAGRPDAEPKIPPACDRWGWREIGTASPGREFVRDRRTGNYVERPIRP